MVQGEFIGSRRWRYEGLARIFDVVWAWRAIKTNTSNQKKIHDNNYETQIQMTSTKIDTFYNERGSKNLIFSPLQMKTNQKLSELKYFRGS